jgi:hypothetical protein
VRTDFVTFLEALRVKPQSCTMMEMPFPAKDGRPERVRSAVPEPVTRMTETSPDTTEGHPPFCPCCLTNSSRRVLRSAPLCAPRRRRQSGRRLPRQRRRLGEGGAGVARVCLHLACDGVRVRLPGNLATSVRFCSGGVTIASRAAIGLSERRRIVASSGGGFGG